MNRKYAQAIESIKSLPQSGSYKSAECMWQGFQEFAGCFGDERRVFGKFSQKLTTNLGGNEGSRAEWTSASTCVIGKVHKLWQIFWAYFIDQYVLQLQLGKPRQAKEKGGNSSVGGQSIDVALGDMANFAGSPTGQVSWGSDSVLTNFKRFECMELAFFNCSVELAKLFSLLTG